MLFRLFTVLMAWWLCPAMLMAQQGLAVAPVFDGRYQSNRNAVEVVVKGRKLKPYGLTLFKSITLKELPTDAAWITRLVEADSRNAMDKEEGRIRGRLYYGFYRFKQEGNVPFRYIFFRNNALRRGASRDITVVYMEGNVTIARLKEMFR